LKRAAVTASKRSFVAPTLDVGSAPIAIVRVPTIGWLKSTHCGTAKALGLTVSQSLLAKADEVIE
jgi:hypothetical protein